MPKGSLAERKATRGACWSSKNWARLGFDGIEGLCRLRAPVYDASAVSMGKAVASSAAPHAFLRWAVQLGPAARLNCRCEDGRAHPGTQVLHHRTEHGEHTWRALRRSRFPSWWAATSAARLLHWTCGSRCTRRDRELAGSDPMGRWGSSPRPRRPAPEASPTTPFAPMRCPRELAVTAAPRGT